MAVDLKQLGKLLALTRSSEPAEALRAEELFTALFFKWCDANGLAEDVGFARVGDASDLNLAFLETVTGVTKARVLQLNAFDLCLVGTLPECRAVAWWFENVLPEMVTTAKRSANAQQDSFLAGACRGIADELYTRRPIPTAKVIAAVSPVAVSQTAPPQSDTSATGDTVTSAPPPAPPRVPSAAESSALREGHAFGRKLAVRMLAKSPYPMP